MTRSRGDVPGHGQSSVASRPGRARAPADPEPPVVRADAIVLHNPSCLSFDNGLEPRLSCVRPIVVTHENFLRPGGPEAFDVAHCLALVDGRAPAGAAAGADLARQSRRVAAWRAATGDGLAHRGGRLAQHRRPALARANPAPRDRRGRHSRPGFDKFPTLPALRAQFPPMRSPARSSAPTRSAGRGAPPRTGSSTLSGRAGARFLTGIDFFVYFTNPLWQESFGRVIAEAIAAGKVVITDPDTAEALRARESSPTAGDGS